MPPVRAKAQRYSEEEDAYLLNYREWRNDKVSESWAQFRVRYENKFWIDHRTSGSLLQRAKRLSGHRHQALSQGRVMMRHMLKIRKSSLWWTWGRFGQAFGTNAKRVYSAYKSFLQRHGIHEVENESGRIRWSESEMRKLKRAHYLGQSWEQIARSFGYEEPICLAAHWIHSYGEVGSGNLHTPYHPKYFFPLREETSKYSIRKSSGTQETKDRKKERQLEEGQRAQLPPRSDTRNGEASKSGGLILGLGAVQSVKRESTSELEHDRKVRGYGQTNRGQQSHVRNNIATAVKPRGGLQGSINT